VNLSSLCIGGGALRRVFPIFDATGANGRNPSVAVSAFRFAEKPTMRIFFLAFASLAFIDAITLLRLASWLIR
jgi:hypothetical protein